MYFRIFDIYIVCFFFLGMIKCNSDIIVFVFCVYEVWGYKKENILGNIIGI